MSGQGKIDTGFFRVAQTDHGQWNLELGQSAHGLGGLLPRWEKKPVDIIDFCQF